MGPELWSVSRIAAELRINNRRISQAIAGLEPAQIKGKRKFYWLRDVIPRLFADGEDGGNAYDLAYQKARQHKETADKLAMENARTRADTVSASEVATLWETLTIEARQRIMTIPARLADQLTRMRSRAKIKALIDKECRAALSGLSDDRAGVAPGVEDTRPADVKRMGG